MAAKEASEGEVPKEKMPIYEKIAWQLRKKIMDGDYQAHSKLPIEKDLREEFGVSRHTIREALRLLRQENLISSNKKAGTVLNPPTSPASNFLHALSVDELLTFSNQWKYTTENFKMTSLGAEMRALAGIDEDDDWLRIQGIAQYEFSTKPECWFSNYVHPSYAGVRAELEAGTEAEPILPLIERSCGVTVVTLEQEVSAIALSRDVAEALQAEDEAIAMNVRRICRVIGGKVALIADEIYPASRFKYRFSLDRQALAA